MTPNELLWGMEEHFSYGTGDLKFLECEERLNVELAHGQHDNDFDSEEEWKRIRVKAP